jgi:predicted SAM-dependent methyltransferase
MKLEDIIKERQASKTSVKLHLGCGNRYFDGYINVDGEYMKHDPNVTIHDITKPFPISDNCVDEILTVHVIEHISRSLVPPMFKEFHRICKPGGIVAMEWPDMLKMCTEIAKNPNVFWSDDRRVLKRTILGIFGDNERYPDIAMMHKWGYSAESMGRLFLSAGFTRYEVQPNQHSKTPNDSRVVAYK